jgi:hypothetical protein
MYYRARAIRLLWSFQHLGQESPEAQGPEAYRQFTPVGPETTYEEFTFHFETSTPNPEEIHASVTSIPCRNVRIPIWSRASNVVCARARLSAGAISSSGNAPA